MGRAGPGEKNHKDPIGEDKIKEKYRTEPIVRPKCKDLIQQVYNTTPGDKYSPKKKEDICTERRSDGSAQFQYLKNNLCIKSCIGNCDLLRFQVKKVTIRNYTPKILNQEINMGMWM